jgi:RNA polymerase sigma-70 factor (ECF subfamily)
VPGALPDKIALSRIMQEFANVDFEKLFKQHNKDLCDLAYNLVRDKDAAKDVVQEVFLKLWKNRDNVDFGGQIRHYLFKATAHTSLNHLRTQKKIVKLDDDTSIQHLKASSGTEEIGYQELELRVRHAIDRLPPKCKAIYILSRQEGLKYQEIADTLDLSIKTVENQMGIALEKLRTELKPFLSIEFMTTIIVGGFSLFELFY